MYIKSIYEIDGKIHYTENGTRFNFIIPINEKTINVKLCPNENKICAYSEVDISEDIYNVLQNEKIIDEKFYQEIDNSLSEPFSFNHKAIKKVLLLIKYCFQQTNINENLIVNGKQYCSRDNLKWILYESGFHLTVDSDITIPLNQEKVEIIQKYINENYIPFFALSHLHRAMTESNPRYKWIDATISAELAIKEFLIRKEPTLEALLMDVPSPPLHKLYGSLLKEYAGVESPRKTKIQKGVKTRNDLVHKPETVEISRESANEYVHDVQTAVYHLLTLLHPHDSTLRALAITHLDDK